MKLRLGLLSTANINVAIIEGARASGAVEVVAVGSRDLDRARAYAAGHGIRRAHGSYEDLLADADVDAVYVSLPNALHVEWSIRALEAGKHVLCEKPLSRHPHDVERAYDVAERHGRVLMEAFMWRHHPQARLLERSLGRIGTLRLVRAAFSFPERAAEDIRLSGELEGGALMDVGCYCVSAIRLVAGEPESVTCRVVIGAGGVDLLAVGGMYLPRHVLAHFDCGMVTPLRDELEVVGSQGSLFLDDPWKATAPVIELRGTDGNVLERLKAERVNPYACELQELAAVAAGERVARFGREDAVHQARALERLFAAAEW